MTVRLTLDAFLGLLRDLDDEELAAFVADLWSEAGWETRVDGRRVFVARAGSTEERLLAVYADDRGRVARLLSRAVVPDRGEADAVVLGYLADSPDGVETIDAEDLYERLLFALDREACRDLCRRHFDRSVDPVFEEHTTPFVPPRVGELLSDPEGRNRLVLSVTALIVLIAIGVVATGPLGGPSSEPIRGTPADLINRSTPVGGSFSPTATGLPTPTSTPSTGGNGLVPLGWANWDHVGAMPTCNRTPAEVVTVFLGATRLGAANDTKRFRTMAAFTDPRIYPSAEGFEEFAHEMREGELGVLFRFRLAYLGDSRFVEDPDPTVDGLDRTTVVQQVVVVDDMTWYTFEFTLSKRLAGEVRGCWQIQAIHRVGQEPVAIEDDPMATPGLETPPNRTSATTVILEANATVPARSNATPVRTGTEGEEDLTGTPSSTPT